MGKDSGDAGGMAPPLRIEFPGAIYHVTARGDRREAIFEDDEDRHELLGVVDQALGRFDAKMLAYCLMGNHYHFVLQTLQGNLSQLMRHINGVYTQRFNRRHSKIGHLFQGRFKAILVDRDAYLLEVCRYVEVNPVRAGMVAVATDWPWSSYRAHVGKTASPCWLDTSGLLSHLLGRDLRTESDRRQGERQYEQLVATARGLQLWDGALRQQIYLGDDAFVQRMQAMAPPRATASPDIPKIQRRPPLSFAQWRAMSSSSEEALARAHVDGGISMTVLAEEIGVSVSRVSQIIQRRQERNASKKRT